MFSKINELIKKYEKIIIHRHKNPDMDAIGSQLGLYYLIKENYPGKEVYVVGDQNKFDRDNMMMDVNDGVFKNALSIIVDVAVSNLISDDRYKLAKEVLIIDHHNNEPDIENAVVFMDISYSSAAEYITDIFRSLKYKFNKSASSYLLWGMITDTGRFQWMKDAKRIFDIASFLSGNGAETRDFYNWLYTETLEDRKIRNYFQNRFVYEDNIAYLKNDKEVMDKFDVDFFTISRGMVNLAAGIEEIKIWLNFTYDKTTNKIFGEFRSRDIIIVDIAKKYGGGGHDYACGATLNNWDEVDLVINDYRKLIKE
ncbi:MAG: DHH family phosphoesterase [Acholeplasmatales bacterium]